MRQFMTLCKDTITNGFMVLSEASYNQACSWLEEQGFECDKVHSPDGRFTKIYGYWKTNGRPTEFIYDEHRGYLVMMEN